jgi:hypothetical protein
MLSAEAADESGTSAFSCDRRSARRAGASRIANGVASSAMPTCSTRCRTFRIRHARSGGSAGSSAHRKSERLPTKSLMALRKASGEWREKSAESRNVPISRRSVSSFRICSTDRPCRFT